MPSLDFSKDYYKILGLDTTADESDIKKAYRTLARKWHPDKNDAPNAEDKFKEIKAAYEFLESKDRREIYARERNKQTGPYPTSCKTPTKPSASKSQTSNSSSSSQTHADDPSNKKESAKPGATSSSTSTDSGKKSKADDQSFKFKFQPTKESYAKTSFDFRRSTSSAKETKPSNGEEFKTSSGAKQKKQKDFVPGFRKSKYKTSNLHSNNLYSDDDDFERKSSFSHRQNGKHKTNFREVFETLFNAANYQPYDLFASMLNGARKTQNTQSASFDCESEDDGIDLRFSPPRKPKKASNSSHRKSQVYGKANNVFNDPEIDQDLFNWSKPRRVNIGGMDPFGDDSNGSDDEGETFFPCAYCSKQFSANHLRYHEPACRESTGGSEYSFGSEYNMQGDWKKQHEDLIDMVRTAKRIYSRKKDEYKMPDPDAKGMVFCKFCGRTFSRTAASKHIAFCKRRSEEVGVPLNPRYQRRFSSPASEQGSPVTGEFSHSSSSAPRSRTSSSSRNFMDEPTVFTQSGLSPRFTGKRQPNVRPPSGKQKERINLNFNVSGGAKMSSNNEGCSSCQSQYGNNAKVHCSCGVKRTNPTST